METAVLSRVVEASVEPGFTADPLAQWLESEVNACEIADPVLPTDGVDSRLGVRICALAALATTMAILGLLLILLY